MADETKTPDVALTAEEEAAALQAARDAKAAAAVAAEAVKEAEKAAAVEAAKVQERADNPQEFAGLEDTQGNVQYVKFPARRERVILIEDMHASYEHVRTDAQGVWVYRKV